MNQPLSLKIISTVCLIFYLMTAIGCTTEKAVPLEGITFKDQWIRIKSDPLLDLTGDLTIDMYIKLHQYPDDWAAIISKESSYHQSEFTLRIKDRLNGRWYYGDGSAVNQVAWNPEELLPLNTWVRITAVRSYQQRTLKIYVNGKIKAEQRFSPFPRAVKTDSPLTMLRQRSQCLHTTIAEVRIWDQALSQDVLATIIYGQPAGKVKVKPVGSWKFIPPSQVQSYGDYFEHPEILSR
ncbi:LamG domain-containing protein [Desulfonatronovibrio magnus]|uniref:LamG domain-containing protein n=1 Tax=Desulfonatronovibrio magnus TaxID=698827 RepID=UPI0018DBFD9F|nr:LamG domain-containing protein [Desulfonatronovibrio magnus]